MNFYPPSLTQKIGFTAILDATLAHTSSAVGRTKVQQIRPSTQATIIEDALAKTQEMMDLLQNDAAFPLRNMHDVREWAAHAKAEGSMLSLEALLQIWEASVTARRIKSFINDRGERYPALQKTAVALIPLSDLEAHIKAVIDENGAMRTNASPELKRIRNRLNKRRTDLRTTINRVMSRAQKQGMASDEGPTLRGGRMVIPIQAEYKRKMQGFVHDVSSTGKTVYLEPVEALDINNDIRELKSAEKKEIERILRKLTGEVRSRRNSIIQNVEILGTVDMLAAKARVCITLTGFVPVRSGTRHLYLKEAYNPILELKNSRSDTAERDPVVPLDLELQADERCLVITGPNAGGKSVAMKTLALCVLMMQAGYAIPARDSSEIPIYSGLFVDMGDDQSIENDLSTFSSRLAWMKQTLQQADADSLVLIDEAAAGTDPEEGGALFQAFIEELMHRGCTIIATTHHGSLKLFAHEHEQAVNGSMEFSQDSLSPTYTFKKGIPGSSYAFEIAQRMELDGDVLGRARTLLGDAKNNMEALITELETKTQQAEELRKKYEALQQKMEAERSRYKEKRSGLEKNTDAIREKALKEAQQIMQSANQQIEEAVEHIVSQGKKDDGAIKEARQQVDQHKQRINQQIDALGDKQSDSAAEDTGQQPAVGDLVRLSDGTTTGELEEINGSKAVVLAGGLRLKTSYSNLVKVKDAHEMMKAEQQVTFNYDRPTVNPSIEIRGMRGKEAMKEVVQYLDNAIASGRNEVDIIHGKGEGILKQMVHDHLDDGRKEVKSYAMASRARGGAGCTVVKL